MTPDRAQRLLARFGWGMLLVVLVIRIISLGISYLSRPQPTPPLTYGVVPTLGNYSVLTNTHQLAFTSEVFSKTGQNGGPYLYDLEEGTVLPGKPSKPTETFVFKNGQVVAWVDGQISDLPLTPPGLKVYETAFSTDDRLMAFINRENPDKWKLYALSINTPARQVTEAPFISGMAWTSQSNKRGSLEDAQLAYIVPQDGIDQLFTASFNGAPPRQLTNDRTKKAQPAWSTDGKWLAYLAFDPADSSAGPATGPLTESALKGQSDQRAVYILPAAGGSPKRVAQDHPYAFDLAWEGDQLTFSEIKSREGGAGITYRYAVPTEGDASKRLFPPVIIEKLSCSPEGNSQKGTLQFTLSNTGPVEEWYPVLAVLYATPTDRQMYGSVPDTLQRARTEKVLLQPGETKNSSWSVPLSDNPTTYLSLMVIEDGPGPFSEFACKIVRKWLGIPSIPWLPFSVVGGSLGALAVLPALRKEPKWLLKLAWAGAVIGIIGLIAAESLLVI